MLKNSHYRHLTEILMMSTHNICFHGERVKNSFLNFSCLSYIYYNPVYSWDPKKDNWQSAVTQIRLQNALAIFLKEYLP